MRLGYPIENNLSKMGRIGTALLMLFSLGACCPKDGVDRSYEDNLYNITLDIQNVTTKKPIDILDTESKVFLVLNNGTKMSSTSFLSKTFPNRFTFYFDSNVKDEDISAIDIQLIDYQNQLLNFKTTPKTLYQRDPTVVAQNRWDGFFCNLNPLNILLPSAEAMSCKAKEGSKITWRPGFLFSVDLVPEI